jgi:alpha-galactosidase
MLSQCVQRSLCYAAMPAVLLCSISLEARAAGEPSLQVTIRTNDGEYTIGAAGLAAPILHAGVAAKVDGRWLHSDSYPKHTVHEFRVSDQLGDATEWDVTFSGIPNAPQLTYKLLVYSSGGFGEIEAAVHNVTSKPIQVESIRMIEATGDSILDLGGPSEQDRVLSDSFSEDVPPIKIRDLKDADDGGHRAIGSQLIYNQHSHWSFFVGAISSNRFLTILRLSLSKDANSPRIATYEADSSGTTEITRENSLLESAPEDQVTLSLQVEPGEEIPSERLAFSASKDYHGQLETYGSLVRQIYHARTAAPAAMGWWSWTAYYYGLNEGSALTNAQWMAEHLRSLGFTFFHLDEGYQFARGDYTSPDATLFPHGVATFEDRVRGLGLTPGLWTAPFEVSERSWVYQNHLDWLVRNASGQPIHLGWANNHHDRLYALDTTNPGAQEHLRHTYTTLVKDWGIRYIKLDFMDDSAVEGYRYRAETTAMQAQRIGLEIIRQTVGDDVLLDKDGSAMLNPVGYVDYGRTGQDTGHTFHASKEAAPAIAARYYMNRNFFVSDPDAFTVSTQVVKDHTWNGGTAPLTLDEAKVSIALSAVSGGLFEIGDDLPTLARTPERLALVQNSDLLNMVVLSKASLPVDLMTYAPSDEQPSIFFLRETPRRSILTVFNWTDKTRTHTLELSALGLDPHARYRVLSILDNHAMPHTASQTLTMSQPAHSVCMFKIIDTAVPAMLPQIAIDFQSHADAGESVRFSAHLQMPSIPVTGYRWNFGDGVSVTGAAVAHAYTRAGRYRVQLESTSLDGLTTRTMREVIVGGSIPSVFNPAAKKRFVERQP